MENIYIKVICSIVLVILIFFALYFKKDSSRHSRNIQRAKNVLDKINSFTGVYREAQQMMYLKKINPFVFEELLLTAFQRKGYVIFRNSRYTGDGGIDGRVVDNDGNVFIIQAKRYSGFIKPQHLAELASCVASNHAAGGFFIHTGKTSKMQLKRHQRGNISIISGNKLIKFIQF